ncbi:PHP domain-containing protein [Candidatus Bathyarchaeota archaeon]|nr:PHP domain-containing protein [Candidatus Bathyarchaeota archaeon]
MTLKIDLHVHTIYSYDSLITPEQLVFYARKRGLDGVAITDHDRLDSAVKLARELKELLIIPGMEISSKNGHIIALNATEMVPAGLNVCETLDRIHKVGGLAIACHPIGIFKGSLQRHMHSLFDAVEVVNSSVFPFNYSVRRSRRMASQYKIPMVAGSDAHYGPEIGYAYTEVDADPEIEEITSAIKKGFCYPHGMSIPIMTRVKRKILLLKRRFS